MDALIVASTQSRQYALTDVLHREKINCVVCYSAAEARRASLCRPFDLFVIFSGLPDEHGNELAIALAEANDCGGIYIDDVTRTEQLQDELNGYGIITLTRPVTRAAFIEAVRMIVVSNMRVQKLKARNEELTVKLEDAKCISRAKIALMRSLGYSEDQAHKYIERKAMEMRVSRQKIAMDILRTYEAI